jgi:hypothetical protein
MAPIALSAVLRPLLCRADEPSFAEAGLPAGGDHGKSTASALSAMGSTERNANKIISM